MKKLINWFQSLHLVVQCLAIIGALGILILSLIGISKILPYILFLLVLVVIYFDDIKRFLGKNQKQAPYQYDENMCAYMYADMAETLYAIISPLSGVIGAHISDPTSFYNSGIQWAPWNGVIRYKYKVRLIKSGSISTDQLISILQDDLDRNNISIWITDLRDIGSHIVINVVPIYSDADYRLRKDYEERKQKDLLTKTNGSPLHKDRDF